MPSIKENIKKMREEFEKNDNKDNIKNKIKEEIEIHNRLNFSQNQLLEHLEEKKHIAEEKKENDIANMYSIAIAILKDLWSKTISEAEGKKLKQIVEKTGIKLEDYKKKEYKQKQQYMAQKLSENFKKRQDLLNNAKKIVSDNVSIMKFCENAFGNIGANIINHFNLENKQQNCIIDINF